MLSINKKRIGKIVKKCILFPTQKIRSKPCSSYIIIVKNAREINPFLHNSSQKILKSVFVKKSILFFTK